MSRNVIATLGFIGLGVLGGCSGGGNTALTTIPTARLTITLPAATVGAGVPFTFTVTALNAMDAIVPTYIGTVQITTSDPSATLPADRTLARGVGKFTLIFNTTGSQTITASDTVGDATSGTSAAISVSLGVSINPATVTLPAGGVQAFTATVEGTSNHGVTWSVQEGVAGGTITSAGVYTAPLAAGTYHVIVVSQADTGKSAVATVIVPPRVVSGAFAAVGNLATARAKHSATLLPNGKVLIAGGAGDDFQPLASGELYDPSSGRFSPAGNMTTPRSGHTAILLANGKVLIAGGAQTRSAVISGVAAYGVSAELYDPSTGIFTATGSMLSGGWAVSTLLPDGRALVAKDVNAEIYDPVSGSFTLTAAYADPNQAADTATLLLDGMVLVTGGCATAQCTAAGAELYDPRTGLFSLTGPRPTVLTGGPTPATLLMDGKVLLVVSNDSGFPDDAEVYDPAAGTFTYIGHTSQVHEFSADARLPDGTVLIAGGQMPGGNGSPGTELYAPATGTFTFAGNMITGRHEHTATLLPDGTVLIVGGYSIWNWPQVTPTPTAEIYTK
jgi:Kelch motif